MCPPNSPLAVRSEMLEDIADWSAFLREDGDLASHIRKHTRTGRPLGDEAFIDQLEQITGRALRPKKRGPKPWS